MKIRSDFVTNSSSSSFTLMIEFHLEECDCVRFEAQEGAGEEGRIDYFDSTPIVKVSPKQLGCAKDIDDLIQLLENGVVDGWDETKIFDKSRPMESDYTHKVYDAYDFILEISNKIKSMDQIKEITISGYEEADEYYNRSYTYNLRTKMYTGVEEGFDFEMGFYSGNDVSSDENFRFTDIHSCVIKSCSDERDQNKADTEYLVSARSAEELDRIINQWEDADEDDEFDDRSFEKYDTDVFCVMEKVIKVVHQMEDGGQKDEFTVVGVWNNDVDCVVFMIEYAGEEPLIKASQANLEKNENRYFKFAYSDYEEIPKLLERNKKRTFKQAIKDKLPLGRFLDVSYEEWYNSVLSK